MKYFLIGLCIGAFLSILCWIAEDHIKNGCVVTNRNTTVICPINGQNIHFYREGK